MKKLLFLFAASFMLASCGGEKSENEKYYDEDYQPEIDTTSAPVAAAEPVEPEEELHPGAKLITSSDCRSCHQDEVRVVGPAYKDVAEKYEDTDKNIDYLAKKIIEGGSGVWGEIAMNPHPNISEDDAKEMARYVLSLNDAK